MAAASKPPPPPPDAEEQAQGELSKAEQALLILFAASVLANGAPDRPLSDVDLHLLRRASVGVLGGVIALTLGGAGMSRADQNSYRLEHGLDSEIEAIADSSLKDFEMFTRALRRGISEDQKITLAERKKAAEALAVHMYNKLAIEVADKMPTPPEYGIRTIKKTWVSRLDPRVRPLHRLLHGKTVGATSDFYRWPATGQRLRYPGDHEAPPDATYGCRCVAWISWSTADEVSAIIKAITETEEDKEKL